MCWKTDWHKAGKGCFSEFAQGNALTVSALTIHTQSIRPKVSGHPIPYTFVYYPVHKERFLKRCFFQSGVERIVTHGALTSHLSNTFGMNFTADCEPCRLYHPTSVCLTIVL